jgi:hypothetical protein
VPVTRHDKVPLRFLKGVTLKAERGLGMRYKDNFKGNHQV